MSNIEDVTNEFKRPRIYANARGVYLLLVHNNSDFDVHDRNKRPGTLVKRKGWMLKTGKFEGGLFHRMLQNQRHYHRKHSKQKEDTEIFSSILELLLVRYLDGASAEEVRRIETHLKRSVRRFLEQNGLNDPGQRGNSESRYLIKNPPPHRRLKQFFRDTLTEARA